MKQYNLYIYLDLENLLNKHPERKKGEGERKIKKIQKDVEIQLYTIIKIIHTKLG